MVVESSLSRRRDFDITAWVAAALPAAAASWRYVRNLWIDEPSGRSEKWNLHLWHHGDTFQQTLLQCSDSPIAQTEKFDTLDCTNSTVGETCVVGCAAGYELASGDSLRALTCVSENESFACLTGSLPARQVTRCSTRTIDVANRRTHRSKKIRRGGSRQRGRQMKRRGVDFVGSGSPLHLAFAEE